MIETALVFSKEGAIICWHEPPGRSSGSLPDSQSLWDVLWLFRAILGGVAHTHPWDGKASPSHTDVTTFLAIEKGLGRKLLWPVVTFTDVGYFTSNLELQYTQPAPFISSNEWKKLIEELRRKSRNGG